MRTLGSVTLLVALVTFSTGTAARAETRFIVDVGSMFGKTSTLREHGKAPESGAPPVEGAAGIEARIGVAGAHYVTGVSTTAWGATASSGSLTAFGGLAARSQGGFALELTGGLGGQLYDGYRSGGFYTDVETTSVLLPFVAGQLQTWIPVRKQKMFLGVFAQARSDLGTDTGTATVVERCTALCEIFGGHDAAPVVHSYAVGGQSLFVGLNFRFSADALVEPSRQPDRTWTRSVW